MSSEFTNLSSTNSSIWLQDQRFQYVYRFELAHRQDYGLQTRDRVYNGEIGGAGLAYQSRLSQGALCTTPKGRKRLESTWYKHIRSLALSFVALITVFGEIAEGDDYQNVKGFHPANPADDAASVHDQSKGSAKLNCLRAY